MDQFLLVERDGCITIRKEGGIATPEETSVLPFVQEALFTLVKKGVKVIVLSDQSEIVPAKIDASVLDEIHERMKSIAEDIGGKIADIITCPNGNMTVEECAFPRTGLLEIAAEKYGFPLFDTPFITSSYEALQAAWAAGCKPVFVKTGKPYKTMQALRLSEKQPEFIALDLLTAVVKLFP